MAPHTPRSAPAAPPRRRPSSGWIVAWIFLLALYVVVRRSLLDVPLDRDEGLYASIGQAILRGELPYRDVFEHKPPGLFYVFALAVALVTPTAAGLHLFLAGWNLLTAAACAWVACQLGGAAAAWWTTLCFIVATGGGFGQGFALSSEMLLLLPLTLSVGCAVRAVRSGGRWRSLLALASGALAAGTFWIKQPALVAAAAGPLVFAAELRGGARRAWLDLVLWAIAAVGVSLAATLAFVFAGTWDELVYWSFTHNLLYGQLKATDQWQRIGRAVASIGRDVGVPLALAAAGLLVGWRRARRTAAIVGSFLVLSTVAAFHSPFLYPHYFAILAPALAIAAGVGIAWLQASIGPARRRFWFMAVAAAAVVTVPIALRPWYWLAPDPIEVSVRSLGSQAFEAGPMLAAYLHERTRADEAILIYGSEPQILFLAERRNANRFGNAYPLTWHWPRHREFQEQVWRDVQQLRPPYLVIPHTPYTLGSSPEMDPFFEQHLEQLGARSYRIETFLKRDGLGRLHFDAAPPAGQSTVLFELWRRID